MIAVLTYVALISGGLLVLILLLGILGGLDLDIDLDADIDGGFGYVKGVLTFVSIGSWVVRLALLSALSPWVAILVGVGAGAVGVLIIGYVFRILLDQQEEVNWSPEEALRQSGKVYLRIPAGGEGIVQVSVRGTKRELKARSHATEDIPTGASVLVEEINEAGLAFVRVE